MLTTDDLQMSSNATNCFIPSHLHSSNMPVAPVILQRAVVASLHGLAGLLMLEGNGPAALAIYRQVLARIDENKQVKKRETVVP